MKKALVVYYSRTSLTRRIASEIGRAFDCEIEEIEDVRSRAGAWGFLKSAFQVLFNMRATIKPIKHDPARFDLVIIGTPIWMGNLALPIRTYVVEHQAAIKEMAFFCTYGQGNWQDALRDLRGLTGKWPVATLAIADSEITDASHGENLRRYLGRLSDHAAPRLKATA